MESVLGAPKLPSATAVALQLYPWAPIPSSIVSRSTSQRVTVTGQFPSRLDTGLSSVMQAFLRLMHIACGGGSTHGSTPMIPCRQQVQVRQENLRPQEFLGPPFGSWMAPLLTMGPNYSLHPLSWDTVYNPLYSWSQTETTGKVLQARQLDPSQADGEDDWGTAIGYHECSKVWAQLQLGPRGGWSLTKFQKVAYARLHLGNPNSSFSHSHDFSPENCLNVSC